MHVQQHAVCYSIVFPNNEYYRVYKHPVTHLIYRMSLLSSLSTSTSNEKERGNMLLLKVKGPTQPDSANMWCYIEF